MTLLNISWGPDEFTKCSKQNLFLSIYALKQTSSFLYPPLFKLGPPHHCQSFICYDFCPPDQNFKNSLWECSKRTEMWANTGNLRCVVIGLSYQPITGELGVRKWRWEFTYSRTGESRASRCRVSHLPSFLEAVSFILYILIGNIIFFSLSEFIGLSMSLFLRSLIWTTFWLSLSNV